MRRGLHHFLVLVLAVSTLSAISVVSTPRANADLIDSNCTPTVTGFTVGTTVTAVASGNDCIITFKSGTGTWTKPTGITSAKILIVGGGGAGGTRAGGGGGAGGYLYFPNENIEAIGTVNVTVGAGGTGVIDNSANNGGDSSFGSLTVAKGGGGGGGAVTAANTARSGKNGGSGGGAAGNLAGNASASIGLGTAGQGNAGGSAKTLMAWPGGGGGGSGGEGGTPSSNTDTAGKGGNGTLNDVSGSPVCYATGGGGGTQVGYTAGAAGDCGGAASPNGGAGTVGSSTVSFTPAPPTANTGDGGGGSGWYSGADQVGGNGASGVVIVRFTVPTCSPASRDSGGYTYLTFTSVGMCSWSVPSGVTTTDVLVVGGGGGGGADGGGGGGGGGVYENASYVVTPSTAYSITVGQGGSGGNGYKDGSGNCTSSFLTWNSTIVGCDGVAGGKSAFGAISAAGGGGGGGIESSGTADFDSSTSARGGGGGAGAQNDRTGTGSAGVGGYTGGAVLNGAGNAAGGGAGARGNGSASSGTTAGAGGAGATAALNSIVYGSGGGGGSYNNATAAIGGTNAASGGSQTTGPTTPVANTGGGGGGGGNGNTQNNAVGTSGATGVVIVRYANSYQLTVTQSSNGTISPSTISSIAGGSNQTFTFTPSAGFNVSSITIDGTALTGDTLKNAIGNGYTFSTISASHTVTATYSGIETTGLLVNLDATLGSSLSSSIAAGSAVSSWSSVAPGASFSSIGANSLTASNGTAGASTPPRSVYFDGTGSYINFDKRTNNSNVALSNNAVTIETWINLASVSSNDWDIIASKWFADTSRNESSSNVFHFGFLNSRLNVYARAGTTGTCEGLNSNTTFNSTFYSKWVHVAFTIDATGNLKFYVNGVPDGAYTGCSITDKDSALLIVGDTGAANSMNGSMSRFKMYNVALTATQIQSNFTSEANIFNPASFIEYEYNSATGSNTTLSSVYASGGTAITLPVPTRTNYTFGGWYESSSFTGSAIGSTYSPTQSRIIYAKWVGDSKTITYAAGTGGSGSAPTTPTSVAYGSTFTTPANTYTKSGYTFTGWSDGSSTYAAGATYPASGSITTGITLTAQWTPISVTITTPTTGLTGTVGTSYSLTLSKSGGSGSGTFTLPSGSLPTGVTLNASTGEISGTPTAAGTFAITARITDTNTSVANTTSFSIVISALKLSTPASLAAAAVSGTSTSITVTFNTVSNASSYKVQLFDSGGTQVGSDYSSFTSGSRINGLTAATANSVKVIAVGDGTNYTNSDASSGVSVTTNTANYLDFSGATDQRGFTANAVIPTTGTFTVEAWISPNTYGSTKEPTILSQGSNSVSTSTFWLKINTAGKLQVYRGNGSGTAPVCSANALPTKTWTHVAVSVNGATAICYVNGVAQTAVTIGTGTLGSAFFVGALTEFVTSTQYSFSGQIDEVKIWNTVRTQSQISSNMEVAPISTESGLVAYYPFDATTSTDVTDIKGSNPLVLYTTMTWLPVVRTVTYSAGDNGSGSTAAQTGVNDHSSSITLKDATSASGITRSGYNISAWNTSSNGTSGTSYALGATYLGPTGITLYPTWTANTHTITYAAGTGGSGSAPTSPVSVNHAATFTTPSNTYTKTGYTFAGWSDGTNTYAAGATYPSSGTVSVDVTLTATWTADTNTITYDNQSATTAQSGGSTSYTTGTAIATIPTTAPLKTGYTFAGWFTASSGGSQVTNGSQTPASPFGTVTLYAQWTANTLTVTYDSQGGTSVTAGSVATGANLTAPTAPTKAGYTFSGWSTTSTGSVVSFSGGYAHGQTASFTLYAIWAANALTITYDSKGGTAVSDGTVNTGASISAAPTAPTKTGYTLSGWSATDGGAVVTFPYAHGNTASFTMYAIWSANTLTITYDEQSGSSIADGTVLVGASISAAPTAPIRAGYSLTGWSTTSSGSVVTFPYSHAQTDNFTLYAIWAAVSCSPTSTTTGGYTIYTFTTAGTCFWTVPAGVTDVEVLAVAGGGGGGYAWDNAGAGGGAGGQLKTGPLTLSTTLEVTVGAGGSAGVVSSTRGGTGGNSVVSTITALGGTGGCSARATTCSDSAQATSSAAAKGGAGGSGGASGKGGGGSNTAGSLTSTTAGGTGTASTYSGSSVTYGVGGTGGTARAATTNIAGTAGSANTGNGGGGASAKSSSGQVNGGAGGTGLVVVRVASALTVTYDSQSGSSVSAGSTLTGASISSAPTPPTRSNYTFLGWFTATTGGSAITFPYAHGQTADFTLYARWTLNTYAIAFNANNGLGTMANQSVIHGTAANLNANLFTRANYVFYRWATAADGTGTTYSDLAQVTLTAGTTLYAQWTANTYVVTYAYNSATGGNSTTTSSFTTGGSAITLPTPTRTGYTFGGWYSEAGLSSASSIGAAGASYSPSGATLSLSAYAKWTAVNYTFTYDANSADSGSVPTETSKQITQTATIKANTGSLTRAGYTFGGWNTQSNGSGTNYLSGAIFTVGSSDVTLYAKWSANTYTVTYNSNSGSGSAQRSSSNVASDDYTTGGSAISLPAVGTLQRAGYTFAGWNTSAAGTGTTHAAADNYTTVLNTTLYAKWNAITYAISYNGNTSTGGSTPTTGGYTTGQASPYSVASNTFTKSLHVFGGWNTVDNGSGTNYSPGSGITTLADVVLYAIWIPQYTLHYAINGGSISSGVLPADTLYNSGTSVGPVFSSVSRTGYTFGGWANGVSTIAANGSFSIVADSVLTAIWSPINYTISYNSDGGTEPPASTTKQINQSHTVGSAPTKPGYNFTGWSNGSSVVGAGAVVVTGASDVTYTAQWVAKVYTISYDWNGGRGTAVSDVNYTFGTTAITLPLVGDRVKDGYTFAGWSESSNGSALNTTYIPSQTRTLYAIWNIGNFTVTYDPGRGTVANTTVAVQNGLATVLPLPTRSNFTFNGWHTAVSGGSSVGSNGASFTPTSSQTVYARWIQNSLYGITDWLNRIGTVTTSSNIANTFSGSNSNSSVAVSIPANALPAGTTINFDLVSSSTRATGVISNINYLVSIALSWLTGDETVPDTASDKPITVTISNASIKAGAAAYAIVNNVSSLLGTATQDGVITVSITSDPEIVVAATRPGAPTSVAATSNGNQQSVVSWTAPSSDGGSAITGYTVTANTGATCTTSTTSCTISSLTNGTAYTFTVTATNIVGTSVASSSASATTAALYAVTFDAKGGSAVTSGSFLTASTVSEPTAPTRTGYSFAGWAATDGGSAEVFPYAPGVTAAITMYARWDALDNAVIFDSKGGSSVTATVFSSGGTVAEPTAPTKTGYTFAGWSATDGGTVVTFPYAPGVVTDITLYAKWSVVSQSSSGGGGGGSSSSTPSEPSTPSTPVKSNVTVVAPVTVVGDQDAKVIAVEITTPAAGSTVKPPVIKVDKASEKLIAEVKVVEGKLVLTPETGFSGKKTVTVTITENGTNRFVQIPLTVLPEAVTKPVLTPASASKTIIRWTESPNADAYTVYVNGKKVCSTSALSCSVRNVLGPDARVEIVSNGGDRTVSDKAEADFKQVAPVQITRLVSSTNIKTSLTSVDTKALDKVIALIKNQGFGTIVISNITTTKKTEAAAAARIAAIKKYIDAKTGSKEIAFEVVPAASRTYFNNIAVKG